MCTVACAAVAVDRVYEYARRVLLYEHVCRAERVVRTACRRPRAYPPLDLQSASRLRTAAAAVVDEHITDISLVRDRIRHSERRTDENKI